MVDDDEVREYAAAAVQAAHESWDESVVATNLANRWLEDRAEVRATALNEAVARVHAELDGHFAYGTVDAIVAAVRGITPRTRQPLTDNDLEL